MNNLIQPQTPRLPLLNGEKFLDVNPDALVLPQQSRLFRWESEGLNRISEKRVLRCKALIVEP